MWSKVMLLGIPLQKLNPFWPCAEWLVVLFLLSSTGSWINGQLIKSNGGFSA